MKKQQQQQTVKLIEKWVDDPAQRTAALAQVSHLRRLLAQRRLAMQPKDSN